MKNNIFKIFILASLILIFFTNVDLFKKGYYVLNKDYNLRFDESYKNDQFSGFCSKESHGYVRYIKNRYKNQVSPEIINLEQKRRKLPNWIFYNLHGAIDKNKLILLNYEKSHSSLIDNFMIIDNYINKCLYLERKNGNN
tara:strand:- start:2746 stop:3165 length:420 start_codon:yes stop_codon:yes gene_type:complete